jgi:two-component system CheB/CheR fusion protein
MTQPFLIAIGASAGGLDALYEFFDHTLQAGVSYVIIMHLYPHQKSNLAELLQKHSTLKVCEVDNNMRVYANIIYVMPENQVMSIAGDRLMLTRRDLSIKVNWAIDLFFCSLAKNRVYQKIAIVLSGAGEDGTRGLIALAGAGAYTIAQEPTNALQSSMPLSAIGSGAVDRILAASAIPQVITEFIAGRV